MNGNTINDLNNQFGLWKHLQNDKTKRSKKFRSRRLMTISSEAVEIVRNMHEQGFTRSAIGQRVGVDRSFFYNAINNPKHPNHEAMFQIFGEISRRKSKKKRSNKADTNLEKTDQLTDEILRSIAIERTREIIMSSDNSEFDARYKELALLYKRLKESLRLDKINDPLYEHSKALYDEVTKELINVTRKIYDDRQENQPLQKPQDQKNT